MQTGLSISGFHYDAYVSTRPAVGLGNRRKTLKFSLIQGKMLPENRSRENCIHHHTFLVNALNRVSTEPAGIPAFVDYWYLKTGLETRSKRL